MAQAPLNRPMVVECLKIIISGLEATSLGELSDEVARSMATSLARLLRALEDPYLYSHDTDDATFRTIREIRNAVRMIKVNPVPDDHDRSRAKENASTLRRYLSDLTEKTETAQAHGVCKVVPCPWCGEPVESPNANCAFCGRLPDWGARIDSDYAQAESLLPPGWKGLATFEPLDSVANIAGFLRRELAGLRIVGENGRGSFWLERANELYANVFRALDALRIVDRPEQQPKTNDCDEAERRLSELRRWCARQESDPAAPAFSVVDRFPATLAGHVAFLELVRDEVHFAAEAKRQQLVRGYSNDTLASMVRGIKWAEAGQRVSTLTDLPVTAVEHVARVLQRELTVGTVEQIDELLTQAMRALRDAWERVKSGTDTTKVESQFTSAGTPTETTLATPKPKRRGRPKADYETIQQETKLAADWERARESGVFKPDFAKQNGMTAVKLDALLDRVAARNRRSDK